MPGIYPKKLGKDKDRELGTFSRSDARTSRAGNDKGRHLSLSTPLSSCPNKDPSCPNKDLEQEQVHLKALFLCTPETETESEEGATLMPRDRGWPVGYRLAVALLGLV